MSLIRHAFVAGSITTALLAAAAPARAHPLQTDYRSSAEVLYSRISLVGLILYLNQLNGMYGWQNNPAWYNRNLRSELPAGMTGLAAGEAGERVALWGGAALTSLESDLASTGYDGDATQASIGGEWRATPVLAVGLAVGHDRVDLDTAFNQGNYDSRGWSVAPYVTYALAENVVLGGSLGYSAGDFDLDRTEPMFGGRITAESDYRHLSAAVQVSGYHAVERWRIAGSVGLQWIDSRFDGYSESDGTVVATRETDAGLATLGATLGYALSGFSPYAGLTYRRYLGLDPVEVAPYQAQPDNDADDFLLRAGLSARVGGSGSAALEVAHAVGNEDRDETSIMAGAKFPF